MRPIPVILFAILACANVDGRSTHQIFRRDTKEAIKKLEDQYDILKSSLNKDKPIEKDSPVGLMLEKLDTTVKELKDDQKPGAASIAAKHLESAAKVISTVKDNLETFKSGDALAISKAVCEIVGAVGAFVPPPVGTIISSVMGMVANIMGMFAPQEKQKSIADIVGEVIEKKLKQQYRDQLQGRVDGAMKQMELGQTFLKSYTGQKIHMLDYFFVATQLDMLQHISLTGEMERFIKTLSRSPKEEDAKDAIVLIEAYVNVASMIELLMWATQMFLTETGSHLSSVATGNVIIRAREMVRAQIEFLRNPKIEHGLVLAQYEPKNQTTIEKFMDGLGIRNNNVPLDPNNCYSMNYIYYNRFIVESSQIYESSYLTGLGTGKLKMKFSKSNGYWRMTRNGNADPICSHHDGDKPNNAVSVQFTASGCEKYPDDRKDFMITKFADGDYYMILNRGQEKRIPIWMRGSSDRNIPFTLSGDDLRSESGWVKEKEKREYLWEIKKIDCVGTADLDQSSV